MDRCCAAELSRLEGKIAAIEKWNAELGVQALVSVMLDVWKDCFSKTLGPSERTLINELRDVRNKYAHQKSFSTVDAYRAMDSIARLLIAISAPEAANVEQMKAELLRLKFESKFAARSARNPL